MAKEKIIVVGGSSGMGFAIAEAALHNGYDVTIAGRSLDKLQTARKKLKKVEIAVLDLMKEEQVSKFFSSQGSFDHLVITAASFAMGPFIKMKTEEARRFFDSKFWGQYTAAKYAAQKIKKGGSILFFCGSAAQKPFANFAAGSAINAAIEGLTRALALELSPIRVNAIAPGTIETPVWDVVPEKERREEFKKEAKKLPAKRIGQPEDIAKAALFLIECGYATGSVVAVDGGVKLV